MLRLILSIVGGAIIAFCLVFATDSLAHATAPSLAAAPDLSDRDAMRDYVAGQPVGLLLAIIVGWAVAAFAGSACAARFAHRGTWPGCVVTLLLLLATCANFYIVPHPAWMMVGALSLIALAGWIGGRLFAVHGEKAL